MAKIEESKEMKNREEIVEQTLDRIQGPAKKGGGPFGSKKVAESRFSRHVEDMELIRLMKTEEEEVRQKELNTIAEIVIFRI